MTRAYYAAKDIDKPHCIYKFKSKALRDFWLQNTFGYRKATRAEWEKAYRNDPTVDNSLSKKPEGEIRLTKYSARDMSILEYWDGCENLIDKAIAEGLI